MSEPTQTSCGSPPHTRRYLAFISYRHADNTQEGRRWAEWLHRGLERYVVPPDLIGTPNLRGEPIRDSLYPIFRDEDELPANADLATGIRAALEVSDHLVVLCSPRSAVSPWVRKEVREFKELGRCDRILAIIIAGEPNADDPAKAREGIMRDEECFCEELRFGAMRADGPLDWTARVEPTAADLRPIGTRAEGFVTAEAYREHLTLHSSHALEKIAALTDTYRQRLDQALLKVIAGLLGVPLGQLIDRDAAHRADLARRELARAEAEAARLRAFNRRLALAGSVALALALLAGWFGWRAAQEKLVAEKAQVRAETAERKTRQLAIEQARQLESASWAAFHQAGRLFEEADENAGDQPWLRRESPARREKSQEALLHLARAVEFNPENRVARERFAWEVMARRLSFRQQPLASFRNSNQIHHAAFSPDGSRVVTAGNPAAKIWEAKTGRLLAQLQHTDKEYAGDVLYAAFSRDGTRVVTAGNDGTARVWDADTGAPIVVLPHLTGVERAAFSPDGRWVITTDFTGVGIWDPITGKEVAEYVERDELGRPVGGISGFAMNSDGSKVLSACENAVLMVEVPSGKGTSLPAQFYSSSIKPASLCLSPDGTQFVTVGCKQTQIWNTASGQVEFTLGSVERADVAAFSPDGTRVVVASNYGVSTGAVIFDATTGAHEWSFPHQGQVTGVAFSPDGGRIVTVCGDTAQVWHVATHERLAVFHCAREVSQATFSPDGNQVLTVCREGEAQLWDTLSTQNLAVPQLRGFFTHAAFNADGERFVTSSELPESEAKVWSTATGQLIARFHHQDTVRGAAFSGDGSQIVTASFDRTAAVWDLQTEKQLAILEHGGIVFSAEFSPDGQQVLTVGSDTTSMLWSWSTGGPPIALAPAGEQIGSATFTRDGRKFLTISDAGVKVWSTETHGELFTAPGSGAEFSLDGKLLVTVDGDKVRVRETGQGKEVALFTHAGAQMPSFSPEPTWVVSVGSDDTARVWEVASGRQLAALRHRNPIQTARIHPDGRRLLTTSVLSTNVRARKNGCLHLWEIATGQEIASIRSDNATEAVLNPAGSKILLYRYGHDIRKSLDVRLWDMPTEIGVIGVPNDAMDFHAIAQALSWHALTNTGELQTLNAKETDTALERLKRLAEKPSLCGTLATWLIRRGSARTTSPFSNVTIGERVEALLFNGDIASIRQAYDLLPPHPLVHISLAEHEVSTALETASDEKREVVFAVASKRADFLRGYGVQHLPADASLRGRAAAMLAAQKDFPRALQAADKALALDPQNADAIKARAAAVEGLRNN